MIASYVIGELAKDRQAALPDRLWAATRDILLVVEPGTPDPALEDALLGFPGALVLISHDRALLEAVGSRTLVCENGGLTNHMTGWAEYQKRRDEAEEEKQERLAKAAKPAGKSENARRRGSPGKEVARARRRVENLERKIETAEKKLRELEDELADPAAWSTPEKSERATRRHDAAKEKIAALYAEWEEADRLARETAEAATA